MKSKSLYYLIPEPDGPGMETKSSVSVYQLVGIHFGCTDKKNSGLERVFGIYDGSRC